MGAVSQILASGGYGYIKDPRGVSAMPASNPTFDALLGLLAQPSGGGGGGGLGRLPGGSSSDLEIIYGGNSFNPSSADPSHPTHLHFAYPDGPIKRVLRRIDRMPGFEVGEHPAFGGVAPVHTAGSHHYKRDAGDINYVGGGRFKTEDQALDWLEQMLVRRYG
jgi:hypothetical protein